MRFPVGLVAMSTLLLLSGCGLYDSIRFGSASPNSSVPPSDTFFQERGEADEDRSTPDPAEEGGGEIEGGGVETPT